MIVNPKQKCKAFGCKEQALWGSSSALNHCEAHKTDNEQNLVEGACASCGLPSVLDEKNNCQQCGEFGGIKRNFLVKQLRIKMLLQEKDIKTESYDKILDGGICTKRRPDFVIDAPSHKIVLEVDEHQHRKTSPDSGYACEDLRMWEIAQALGMPTIFIRYNPDTYRDAKGVKQDPAPAVREKVLIGWLDWASKLPPTDNGDDFLRVLYLYYDGHGRPEDTKLERVAPIPLTRPPVETQPSEQITDEELLELLGIRD